MIKGIADSRAEVSKLYVQDGILEPKDHEAMIAAAMNTAPVTAWKDEYGAETPEDFALLLKIREKEGDAGLNRFSINASTSMNPPTGGPTLQGTSTDAAKAKRKSSSSKSKYTVPDAIPEATRKGILDKLNATLEERTNGTANNHIAMNLLPKPASVEIYGKDAVGTIKEESWNNFLKKLEEGKTTNYAKGYRLLEDDKEGDNPILSTTNFNTLKKAFESKATVPVYMSKTVTTPKGYIMIKQDGTEEVLTKEKMYQFVSLSTLGQLTSLTIDDPAVILRQVRSTRDSGNGESGSVRVVLADINAKKAFENGKVDFLQEVDTSAAKVTTTAKADLAMRVVDCAAPKTGDSKDKVRIIRISVTTQAAVLKLKAKYEEMFTGLVGRANKDYTKLPQGTELEKLQAAQAQAIASMKARSTDLAGSIELEGVKDKLAEFGAKQEQAPAGAVM